jgi:hypothetical protein
VSGEGWRSVVGIVGTAKAFLEGRWSGPGHTARYVGTNGNICDYKAVWFWRFPLFAKSGYPLWNRQE